MPALLSRMTVGVVTSGARPVVALLCDAPTFEPLNQLGYCVGVRAGDKSLLERLQSAVHAFVASPEATRLKHKWESAEAPAP